MLLIRTYPHGVAEYHAQFHVYDPTDDTLHWFLQKTDAVVHMAIKNNGVVPSYETIRPDFIIADPDRNKTYRDGIYVYRGNLDPAVANTLHFVKSKHAALKTVSYSKIEELALKSDLPLIGYPNDVEKDFSVAVSFFETAVRVQNSKTSMYSLTEVVDLVRVYGCQHLGVYAPSHYLTTKVVLLAAHYLGLQYREAGDFATTGHRNTSECNKVGAVFLPTRLPPTVYAYHNERLYTNKVRRPKAKGERKSPTKKPKVTQITKTLSNDELTAALLTLPKPDPTSKFAYGDQVTYKNKRAEWGLTEIPFETFVTMITEAHNKQAEATAETV